MESPVRKRLTNVLSVIAWSLVALFCIVFSVTAVEFYFFLKADLVPSYARFLEWAVSHEYAFGANSGMLEGRPYWLTMPEPNKLALAVHTILGAGCLLLAPVQMARWVRKNKRVHRLLGRIYVGAGIVSMLAAMVYLSMTPLTRIFGGRPFAIGLWGVAIITLYTFVMAAVHAARREIWQHRTLMVLNFCLLLIAPLLRLWWTVFGVVFEGITQGESHVAVLMFLGAQVIMVAILASTWIEANERPTAPSATARRFLDATLRLRGPATLLGAFVGLLVFDAVVLRFVGGPGLLARHVPESLRAIEVEVFATASWPNWCVGLGTLVALTLGPSALAGLFDASRAWRSESWPQHLVRIAAVLTGIGLVARALLLSQDWLRGWGGAFYMGTVGTCMVCCVALSTWGHLRRRVRMAREYALHTCALLLLPVTFHGLEAAFLGVGFPYEDAFLSAAVVASSFNLSMSYYYTVYAARRGVADRQPRPVIGATLAA